MEVGFTVNAGPLSQISVHLFSLETAVQLATGALGWWRGPQWTQSLQQTLEAGNAALVPAQTFVRHRYTDFRNDNGGVYGAAMDAGRRFVRMPLPRASTALSEDAGVDCVRALIVGLSCFMDGDQIYGLLKELVPQYLLHTGQDDQPRRLHGASLTAMKNFVTAVLYEETVDKLRDRLFDIIDSQLPRITGASRSELHASRRTEVCHISGVLRWILKPAYKFEGSTKPVYLTRSLKVWALALILAELGFEVEAARSAISSPYDSQQHASFSHDSHLGLPEVVLALTGGWPTDIGASRLSPQAHKLLEEPFRVIPIRAIPILAYAEFLPKITLSTEYLQEAFNGAFIHVQRCLRRQQWVSRATDVQVTETEDIRSHSANEEIILMGSLEEIFGIWTDLHHEDRGMTDRLLLAKGHPRLLLKGLVAKFGAVERRIDQEAVIQIMMVAWLLAVVTLFIRQNGIEDPLDFAYAYRDPFTGTAFLPTNMAPMPVLEPSRKYVTHLWLHRKVRNVFEMLSNLAAICGLAGTTFPHPDQLGMFKMEWERMIEGNLTVSNGFGSGSFPTSTTFGVRRNGLALVSDFIMKPTMRLSSMLLYHIQHGQLLDLPVISEHVDSGTPVRSRGFTPKSSDINITSESDVWPPPEPVNWLRWDAEPCWEADVRTCCFNYRIGGIEQFQLGIHELSNGLRTSGLNTVVCGNHEDHEGSQDHWGLMFNPSLRTVGPDSTERHAQITRAKKWRQLPLVDMLRQGHLDVADVEGDDFPKSCHWLVQVGESEMLAMLALVSRFGHAVRPDVRFVTNCMVAGLDKAKQLGYPEKDVMMIVRSRNSTK